MLSCCSGDCGPGEKSGGIENGKRRKIVVENQGKLGASKNDGIALVLMMEALDNREQGQAIRFSNLIEDESVEDQGVDCSALIGGRRDGFNPEGYELVGIDRSLHEISGSNNSKALEAPGAGFSSNDLCYMNPWESRLQVRVVHGFMYRIVRTDDEIGPQGAEFAAGVRQ